MLRELKQLLLSAAITRVAERRNRLPRPIGTRIATGRLLAISTAIPWLTLAAGPSLVGTVDGRSLSPVSQTAARVFGSVDGLSTPLRGWIALAHRGEGLGAYGDQLGMLLLVRSYASTLEVHFKLPGEALTLLPRATVPWWLAPLHVFNASMVAKHELAEPYL